MGLTELCGPAPAHPVRRPVSLTDWLTDKTHCLMIAGLTAELTDWITGLVFTFAFKTLSCQTPKKTFTFIAVGRHLSRPNLKSVRCGV